MSNRVETASHEIDRPVEYPVLEFRDVRKAYGHVEALREVSLDLRAGEVHGLVGDNGAGKSTLLKIASGAVRPDGGTMLLHGEPIELHSPAQARDLGIETVYQDLALADDRSATANVYLGREVVYRGVRGRLRLLDRGVMRTGAAAILEELAVPITDLKRPMRVFSGGQRQGVAIARAAMWAKQVVLLDEPTAALGIRQRESVNGLIRKLRSNGFGILLVSHDVPELLKLADRITVLRLGECVATRSVGEIDLTWVVSAMVRGGN